MDYSAVIAKAKAGDNAAFEQLVVWHQQRVYGQAFKMLGNRDDALDVTQDVFLKVYQNLASFKEESEFSTWLYRITANAAVDLIRKRSRDKTIALSAFINDEGEEMIVEIPDGAPGLYEQLEQKERMQALSAAIQELSVDDRQCIVLREINGLTYEEIARALDISLGAVKSRIRRARGRLCALILQDGNFSEYSSSNDYAGEVKP